MSGDRTEGKGGKRLQAAMEYLMTYGWVILIIAVVLIALIKLGIFNPAQFGPKASTGSCWVYRPYGPYSTSMVSLRGVCNEQPQYVSEFNGQSSDVIIQDSPGLDPTQDITIVVWADFLSVPPAGSFSGLVTKDSDDEYAIFLNPGTTSVTDTVWTTSSYYPGGQRWWSASGWPWGANVPLNTWHQYVFMYDAPTGTENAYFDAISPGPGTWSGNIVPTSYPLYIGYTSLDSSSMNGLISNVQIYNASLTTSEVQALYDEGIGGAPIKLQNLVGWWPLNGDIKDYSGNGNNGASSLTANVDYTTAWTTGYIPPP